MHALGIPKPCQVCDCISAPVVSVLHGVRAACMCCSRAAVPPVRPCGAMHCWRSHRCCPLCCHWKKYHPIKCPSPSPKASFASKRRRAPSPSLPCSPHHHRIPRPRKARLCTHHTHHMSSGIGSAPHAAVHPAYALQPRTCDSPADVLSAAVIERRLCRRHCSRLQHLRTRRRRSGSRLARPRTHWC